MPVATQVRIDISEIARTIAPCPNARKEKCPPQAGTLEERVDELETRLAEAEKRIKDLNYVIYKVLYELGGKELLARQRTEERH